jgi:hypothetical protein
LTNLDLDLKALRSDAAEWPEFGTRLGGIASWGHTLTYPISEEVALIREFLTAYNRFCETFTSRGNDGKTGMTTHGRDADSCSQCVPRPGHPTLMSVARNDRA